MFFEKRVERNPAANGALREKEPADALSFYHLAGKSLSGCSCAGLACFAARGDAPERWRAAQAEPRVYCLGKCYAGPADAEHDTRPIIESRAKEAVLLQNVLGGESARSPTTVPTAALDFRAEKNGAMSRPRARRSSTSSRMRMKVTPARSATAS